MATLLHQHAFWGALVATLLLAAVFVSSDADPAWSRSHRNAHVVASFAGLRLTPSHVIVGSVTETEQIPITGLAVAVKQVESADGPDVVVTVRGAGRTIERREPLSACAGSEAQIFAIMFNRMIRP